MVALTSPFDPADAGATLMQLACYFCFTGPFDLGFAQFLASKDTGTGRLGWVIIFDSGSRYYRGR